MSFRMRRGRASFSVGPRGPRASYRLGCLLPVVLILAVACTSASQTPRPTPAPIQPPVARCVIPLTSRADFLACKGTAEVWREEVPRNPTARTVLSVSIPEKDASVILPAMAGTAAEWIGGTDSFTLFAFGSEADYKASTGFNRGRIVRNGDTVEVQVCVDWLAFEGADSCSDFDVFTFDWQDT